MAEDVEFVEGGEKRNGRVDRFFVAEGEVEYLAEGPKEGGGGRTLDEGTVDE